MAHPPQLRKSLSFGSMLPLLWTKFRYISVTTIEVGGSRVGIEFDNSIIISNGLAVLLEARVSEGAIEVGGSRVGIEFDNSIIISNGLAVLLEARVSVTTIEVGGSIGRFQFDGPI